MKPRETDQQQKLQLNKRTIAMLNSPEMQAVRAGHAAVTLSTHTTSLCCAVSDLISCQADCLEAQ